MARVFEDEFADLQADMVSICLEYVEERADKVFVYCSAEMGMIYCDCFYQIRGKVLERHKLNTVLSNRERQYDVSEARQSQMLGILISDMRKTEKLFQQNGRTPPVELRMVYDVRSHAYEAKIRYDPICTDTNGINPLSLCDSWFKEEAAKAKG